MFQTSEQTAKLSKVLSKLHAEFPKIVKGRTNPHFKSKYADISDILEQVLPVLSKNGVAVTQWTLHSEDNRVHILTRIQLDDEWMQGQFSVPADRNNPQGYASAVTYIRRISLGAALGIATDDDDDGNQATATHSQRAQPVSKPAQRPVQGQAPKEAENPKGPSQAQIKRLHAIATQNGWTGEVVKGFMEKEFNVTSSKDLSQDQYNLLCTFLEQNKPE
jgi:hypothetical protein